MNEANGFCACCNDESGAQTGQLPNYQSMVAHEFECLCNQVMNDNGSSEGNAQEANDEGRDKSNKCNFA